MTIQCITFDLDDTLWACKPVIQKAEQRFYYWLSIHFPKITNYYSGREIIAHRMQFMQQQKHLSYNLTDLRKRWMYALALEFGYGDYWIEDGFNVFWIARNEVILFAGAEALLSHLVKRFTLVAITNGNAELSLCGLSHYFSYSIHAEEVGVSKPDPKIFHYALHKINVKAEAVIHIGDDPVRDIIGAKQVNMKTIWFNRLNVCWPEAGTQSLYADAEVFSLDDMPKAINTIMNE